MNQVIRTTPRIHPLFAAAAVSVIAVSAAGIGVMTGVLPGTHANTAPNPALAAAAPVIAAPPAPVAAAPATAPAVITQPAASTAVPRPAARARAVRVAAAERTYEDDLPPRRIATRPAMDRPVQRNDAYEPNPYGSPSGSYGSTSGGVGVAQGNPYGAPQGGAYGNAPVPAVQAPAAKAVCGNCGVVEAVVETEKPGDGSGIGMAGGALGGAVVGKQFGKGRGQDFLTILGALGGAYAGHQVEKNVRSTKTYEVRVRMEDGSVRSITQGTPPAWRNGDRVKVDGSSISLSYS